MAAFSTLTPDEQAAILAYCPIFRGNVIAFVKAVNAINAMDAVWNSGIKAINAKLDVATVIPDITNLVGAQTMQMQDMLAAMNALETMLGVNNSTIWRQNYLKFIGPLNAMLQG